MTGLTCERPITLVHMAGEPAAGAIVPTDFVVRARGGAWTLANVGRAVDGCRGQSARNVGKTFLATYGLPLTVTLTYASHGQEYATAIAYAWCRVCDFYIVNRSYDISFAKPVRLPVRFVGNVMWAISKYKIGLLSLTSQRGLYYVTDHTCLFLRMCAGS